MKKIINWFKSSSSDFVLFLILLVLANFVSAKAFKRIDLTKPHSYSLSKASRNIVKNLEEPLSVRVFFDKNLPPPYNSVAQYVEDFLDEYKTAANKNFSVSYMDLSKEENQTIAEDFGLSQFQIQEYKNNEVGFKQVYMGLVITYGDSIEKIDQITTSDGFEYNFTSKVSKMINTADALSGIKGDDKIKISVYITDALTSLNINGCDQLENVISKAYAQVNQQKQDRLQYNVYHVSGTEAQDAVDKYGVQGINFPNGDDKWELGAFGVVIEHGDDFRVLPIQIQQSFFGYQVAGYETAAESINEAIESLMSKNVAVGYITGNNEVNLDDEKGGKTFGDMLSSMYDLQRIDLVQEDIPASMKSIIINGPTANLSDYELYKIDQFLMRGGNVMVFMDALVENPDQNAVNMGGSANIKNENTIDKLLKAYGIQRNYDVVMDTSCYSSSSQQYGELNMYWAPILQKKQLSSKSPITNNLGYVLFVNAGSLNIDDAAANPDVKTTVLAKSSDESWTGDENTLLHPLYTVPPSDDSSYKSSVLAVLVEGKFKSAFDKAPDLGIAAAETESGIASAPVNFEATTHLSESHHPGKIFVAGCSQITTYNVLGTNTDPIGNPVQMMEANLVDYMNGNEDLCSMRSKGLSLNVLTIDNGPLAKILQYFNEYGLAVLVALAGFIVWRMRSKRKARINALYNPDDTRTITVEKKAKPAKKAKKEKSETAVNGSEE